MKKYHIDAIEISVIRAALEYTAEQVHDSDIPAFENYETTVRDDKGQIIKNLVDEDLYQANQDKAELALRLAADIEKLDAEGYNWVATYDNETLREVLYNNGSTILNVIAYHEDIGVYACDDGSCWRVINETDLANLATGEVVTVEASETDEDGNVTALWC